VNQRVPNRPIRLGDAAAPKAALPSRIQRIAALRLMCTASRLHIVAAFDPRMFVPALQENNATK
jgi:hypothetical protein